MKLEIEKMVIERIVSDFQPFLNKRDPEITSHILIETKDGEVIFKATDNEYGITAKIKNPDIKENIKITVNGKKFLDYIKNLDDSKIILDNQDDKLYIKQNRRKIDLPSFIGENFPEFPSNYESSKINIDSKNLIESLKRLLPVIDINSPKVEYRNALIDMKEYKFNFVATDTKRLEIIEFNNQSIDKLSFLLPKKSINELQKLFNDEVNIYFHENNIIFENDRYSFWTRIPNGQFVDYEKIVPKEIKHKIKINKEKMIKELKILNQASTQLKIIFSKNSIFLESINSEEIVNTEIELDSELNKEFIDSFEENVVIGVNSRHIFDFIINTNTTHFEFGINEKKNGACLLKSENFSLILMPILV